MKPKYVHLSIIVLLIVFLSLTVPLQSRIFSLSIFNSLSRLNSQNAPSQKILKTIEHYDPPAIAANPAYTIIFVGDSMTESLGENFDALRPDLKEYYPEKVFGLFNYGFGSTNILSANNRLHQDSTYLGKSLPAILSRSFDIIIVESFGNNPLSEYPLDRGLIMQTEALDHFVAEIADAKPDSLIVFMTTIAPSQTLYGKNAVDLSTEQRTLWANERRAYIENHINYATQHNIPLINVYEASKDANGIANDKYLNADNYIHPSVEGIILISQTIADYFFDNNLLPNSTIN